MGICPTVLELPTAPAQPLPQPNQSKPGPVEKEGEPSPRVSLRKAWQQLGKSQGQRGTRASNCLVAGLTLW